MLVPARRLPHPRRNPVSQPGITIPIKPRSFRRRQKCFRADSARIPVRTASGSAPLRRIPADADDGVLAVGAGFAFEAECIFEIKRDDRVARKFQEKKTQGADGDGVRGSGEFFVAHVGVFLSARDFCSCWRHQWVDQVVRFDAESFAAADFDIRVLGFFG